MGGAEALVEEEVEEEKVREEAIEVREEEAQARIIGMVEEAIPVEGQTEKENRVGGPQDLEDVEGQVHLVAEIQEVAEIMEGLTVSVTEVGQVRVVEVELEETTAVDQDLAVVVLEDNYLFQIFRIMVFIKLIHNITNPNSFLIC